MLAACKPAPTIEAVLECNPCLSRRQWPLSRAVHRWEVFLIRHLRTVMIRVLGAHSERNTRADKLSQSDGQTLCDQAVAIIGNSRLDPELTVGECRAQVLLSRVLGLCRFVQSPAGRPLGSAFAQGNHCQSAKKLVRTPAGNDALSMRTPGTLETRRAHDASEQDIEQSEETLPKLRASGQPNVLL